MEKLLEEIKFSLRRLDAKLTFVGNNQLEIQKELSHLSKRVESLGDACAKGFIRQGMLQSA